MAHVMPVTKADIAMSKKHLKATMKLEKSKIKDHLKMMKQAKKDGMGKSAAYHKAHMDGHLKDIKARQKYMKKVSKLKGK